MSKLASLLGGMTLNDLAKEVLSLQGRGGDTELAHVNKREAALLKKQGGSGGINPNTGMTEYQDEFDLGGMGYDTGAYDQPFDLGGEGYDTGAFQQPDSGEIPTIDMTGQPTPQGAGGQVVSPPQEISGFQGAYPQAGELPTFAGQEQFLPDYTRFRGAYPEMGAVAQDRVTAAREPGLVERAGRLAEEYPKTTRALTAAALGAPGMYRAGQARREAERTRREMEQMAAPIRAQGEAQLAAGQRGELTAPQQQQIQAARAAARQDLTRRGVTSGTAAQQAENRITELAQRFAQQNIENGVRLIGAANSYNAAAIQQAYRMNQDANAMTQNYFTNLMRAYGALPTQTTTTTRTE